jgi:ParB-like chromosome segregation protein Spo0J
LNEFTSLPIEQLHRRADARPLNDAVLRVLTESIEEIGLVNPIRVRPDGDGYEVIAGAHRFAACDLIGLHEIPCFIVNDDDVRAELAMIDENLMRAELSASERATQTARRKAIYLKLHPETAQHVAGGKARQDAASDNLSFASETANATGRDKRTVQRDAERGEKVIPEVMRTIAGTKLDTGAYLDKLKRVPPEAQAETVKRDLATEPPPRQRQGGIAARYAPPQPEAAPPAEAFDRFIVSIDRIEAIPLTDVIAGSGRQRAVLGQRASGLIDRMTELMERLDQ